MPSNKLIRVLLTIFDFVAAFSFFRSSWNVDWLHFYRPQRSWDKVIFSFWPRGRGGRHLLGRPPPVQCMLGYTHPCPVHAGRHTSLPSTCWDTALPLAATAADGKHPTGMHSCKKMVTLHLKNPSAKDAVRFWNKKSYTGSCLQWARLPQAPGYNEQIFLLEKKTFDWHQCLESLDTKSTAYNQHNFMNEVVRCRRDPVYLPLM